MALGIMAFEAVLCFQKFAVGITEGTPGPIPCYPSDWDCAYKVAP